eukprot:365800-Chlamydomonas_euryale.AAC.34
MPSFRGSEPGSQASGDLDTDAKLQGIWTRMPAQRSRRSVSRRVFCVSWVAACNSDSDSDSGVQPVTLTLTPTLGCSRAALRCCWSPEVCSNDVMQCKLVKCNRRCIEGLHFHFQLEGNMTPRVWRIRHGRLAEHIVLLA